ncbi:hypothetical protein LIER_21365 [Lithospermum erythrorhizon]|uniref:Uncharacterized protein n=1 Tax=Lithospermum erythrorhizon TaxID=34254 RepID=A0AAV3QSV3_LITER
MERVRMPSSETHASYIPFYFRSFLSSKIEHVPPTVPIEDASIQNPELNLFQQHVDCLSQDLLSAKDDEFLSIAWLQKLLTGFRSCQEEFRVILTNNQAQFSKPPTDRLVVDLFDRSIKALDICNAARDGIEQLRQRQKHLEIVISALDPKQRMIGEGQFRRATKALMDLSLLTLEEKDSGSVFSSRNRSFGRNLKSKDSCHRQSGHSRSLSWSVSHSWSATKQLQSITNNLIPPRTQDITATNGLAILVYTMNFVLLFVLWALVAAIPCQDRSLNVHFAFPRQNSHFYPWTNSLHSLYDRIIGESKNQRNSNGLLHEICQVEKYVNHITDLVDSAQFPMKDERKEEIRAGVKELIPLANVFKKELGPLERQLREVFCTIMSCRVEGLELLGKSSEPQ